MANVTVIPAKINPVTRQATIAVQKRRVAGYARVSTDSDEQFTSYAAQIDYYTNYIKQHTEWEFVKVYTDEGITGTNTKRRTGFNQMVQDALNGKIDLIVTKSVSRFARNTVDSLVTIRQLKEVGCECYFEKENIYTFDGKGELLLTIMSSLAQEESRSISENVTWGQRKRFADGKVSMPYARFLGYDKGEDGPVVNQEQAKIVRLIYKLFLDGKTPTAIAKELTSMGIPTPGGKTIWQHKTIVSILTNERYKGDALLQKKYTVDFLTKKMKTNEGEVPQYYVTGSHEAIIPALTFDLVQAEFNRRKEIGSSYSCKSIFSTRLICADCGCFYGQKVWRSTDKYRRIVYQCNGKFANKKHCSTPALSAQTIEKLFLKAFNQLAGQREHVLEDARLIFEMLTNTAELDSKIKEATEELAVISSLMDSCVKDNMNSAQSQEEYTTCYAALEKRYQAASRKLSQLQKEHQKRKQQELDLHVFLQELESREYVQECWDDRLWLASIRQGKVFPDGSIEFEFKNGQKIRAGA